MTFGYAAGLAASDDLIYDSEAGCPPDIADLSILDRDVQWALLVCRRRRLAELPQSWHEDTKQVPGRPVVIPAEALIVSMILCVTLGRAPQIKQMTSILFRGISADMRRELELPDPPPRHATARWNALYRNVDNAFWRIVDTMDPSPKPKNRRLPTEDFERQTTARLEAAGKDELARNYDRLLYFINQIIFASWDTMNRELRRKFRGDLGVDDTILGGFSRPPGLRKMDGAWVFTEASDPDCGWHARSAPDDPEAGGWYGRDSGRKAPVWGYALCSVIASSVKAERRGLFPQLVAGMSVLRPPGVEPGKNAIRALQEVRREGFPAGYLAGDRAYTNEKAEHFQLPARALGYSPVLDYRDDQLGQNGSYGGALQIEGRWYMPCIPQELVDATIEYRRGRIDEGRYHQQLESRRAYELRRKERPGPDGKCRNMCGAAGAHPTSICELKPESARRARPAALVITPDHDLLSNPPAICVRDTVTFPVTAGAKLLQDLRYQSPEWRDAYAHPRSSIEGMHGNVKSGSHESLGDSQRRRLRGVAAQSILVAALLFSLNVRLIKTFQATALLNTNGELQKPRSRPNGSSLADFRPTPGYEPSRTDPPDAA